MPVDINEAKQHFANKSAWHHLKGKIIEVGLYVASGRVELNKPAPRNMPVWTLDGDKVSLDDVFRKNQDENKLTILNMGSFTCPVWRERQHKVQELAKLYPDHVSSICIYVREAHASDEWALDMNDKLNISYPKPKTIEERIVVASRAKEELMDTDALVYVDSPEKNAVNKAYSAVPIRICVIDANGELVFRSEGSGPFGYKPEDLATFLEKTIGPRDGIQNIIHNVGVDCE
ncbi:MAG: hypothetical protein COA78_17645 [Blastopirellula sp.]|nr:MAG: hypothetical protein COA78_17645 [Blastopirellula sp.]